MIGVNAVFNHGDSLLVLAVLAIDTAYAGKQNRGYGNENPDDCRV